MKGVFEISYKDGAGRIGKIYTRHGVIETPYFFPVVNIHIPVVGPKDLKALGYNAFITNAYTLWRDEKLHDLALERGIHALFGNWNGPIMTDSGAYQLSVYGDVEVTNREILEFQRDIGVDIGVILDVPLYKGSYEKRKSAIDETIRRAQEARSLGMLSEDSETIWVGPLHGNPISSLLKYSIEHMLKLPFKMYALGSLVQHMEEYQIHQLVRSAFIVKNNFPSNYPIHLFGVGHPMVMSFFALLGFDTFDSALYALAAKDGRYLTVHGTYHIKYLEYFPCNCPVCSKYSPKELMEMSPQERQHYLAMHNLHVISEELRRIKQAIWEGTLWELVARRASSHPELARAYSWLLEGKKGIIKFFEIYEPTFKRRGLMLTRPEERNLPIILRYRRRLIERTYIWSKKLIITTPRGIHKLPSYLDAQVFIIDRFFWLIPRELRNVYPLFQHMAYKTRLTRYVLCAISRFLSQNFSDKFNEIYIFDPDKTKAEQIKQSLGLGEVYMGEDLGVLDASVVRLNTARAMIRFQYGPGAEDIVKAVKFEYSKNTGMLRKIYAADLTKEEIERVVHWELEEIIEDKRKAGEEIPENPFEEFFINRGEVWLLASIVAENFKLVPQPLMAYRLWRRFSGNLKYSIIMSEDAAPFVSEGRSIFAKFILEADPMIRANDEILVLDNNKQLIAIAKAVLGAKEMREFERGVAAKNRWGLKDLVVNYE